MPNINMATAGCMRASKLVEQLQKAIEEQGDLPVFINGSDYPDHAHGLRYNAKEKPYLPANIFVIS